MKTLLRESVERYMLPRGYRLSAFELIPDSNSTDVVIIPEAQIDIRRIREVFDEHLKKPGFNITSWRGLGVVFSTNPDETESALKTSGFTNAKRISLKISDMPLIVNNALLQEFEKNLVSKDFIIPKRYFAYHIAQKRRHINEDLIDLYDGFEYRIRYSRDVKGEGYFALTIDHHLFVNFKKNAYEIIETLSKRVDRSNIKDFFLGRLMIKGCPNACPDMRTVDCPLSKLRRRLSGYIREILFPDERNFDESMSKAITPKSCDKLQDLQPVTVPVILCVDEEGYTYWISSMFLYPEPNLYNVSEFVTQLKDSHSADSAIKDIRIFSFLDSGPERSNPYASRDRFNAITQLLTKVLPFNFLNIGGIRFNFTPLPLEVAV